jgi:hypothetical protein
MWGLHHHRGVQTLTAQYVKSLIDSQKRALQPWKYRKAPSPALSRKQERMASRMRDDFRPMLGVSAIEATKQTKNRGRMRDFPRRATVIQEIEPRPGLS